MISINSKILITSLCFRPSRICNFLSILPQTTARIQNVNNYSSSSSQSHKYLRQREISPLVIGSSISKKLSVTLTPLNYSCCREVSSYSEIYHPFSTNLGLSCLNISRVQNYSIKLHCFPSFLLSTRSYAKGRDKVSKGAKKKSVVDVSPEELNQVVNGARMLQEMDAALAHLKDDLVKAVAVRTNVGSLEELQIELEGDIYPLNELAQVHRKSPQLVVINCSAFPQASKTIVDAIANSGMNLNPQQEGTTIAVPLPKVTREHREGLVGKAKAVCNKCKEEIRQTHNNFIRKAKSKEGQVSDDLLFRVTQKIKEYHDDYAKQVEALLAAKQAELLQS